MTTTSIALCTYNGEKFLFQQLNSLTMQTIPPHEIVICDDCSQDRSVDIAMTFAKSVSVKVLIYKNNENLGYVKNFEKAISLCTKDVIFLCDQDDIWYPSKIKEVLSIFEYEHEVGLVLHDFSYIGEEGQPYAGPTEFYGTYALRSKQLPNEIRRNSIEIFMTPYPRAWCGCMMAFRSQFKNLILPIFPGKGHDDWILKILGPITQARFIASPLVKYRIHKNNYNKKYPNYSLVFCLQKLNKKIELLLKGYTKRNFYEHILKRIDNSSQVILYPSLITLYKKYSKWF